MWLERGTPPLIAALLAVIWLVGSAGSLHSESISAGPSEAPKSASSTPHASTGKRSKVQATGEGSSASAYTIGPADILDISVFNVPDLSQTVEVAATGTINFPLIGEIPAAGRTAQQLGRDLEARLGEKYLQNPQVTVLIKESNSQRVTIQGAVEKPGVYPIKGRTSLLELVAMAGGIKQSSDWSVLVLRESQGRRAAAKFDAAAIQEGQADDPTVKSGDIVIVGTSAIKEGFSNVMKVLPLVGLFSFL